MESFIILCLFLLALAPQTKAVSHCPVDVVFIMESSECISQATFLKEKNFVKQAAVKLGVPSQSRAAIIQFSRSATVKATFGQYPTKQRFEEAVDGLRHELPRTASFDATTQIDEALNVAARDDFLGSGTSNRRIAILLTDGKQVISATEVSNLRTASVNLRKLGVRLLVVTMGTSSSALDTILKSVTERNEDVVMDNQLNDLLNKLPGMIACGSCVCTSGDSYITINNYEPKKNRATDDIRFEFKSATAGSGLIMFAKGSYVDHVFVGLRNKRLWYNVDLGSGVKNVQSSQQLNSGWHNVHITRNEQSVEMKITDEGQTSEAIPGRHSGLDLPSSKGYFLGAPRNNNLRPNFDGCIRYFTVDGYEPIVNAWESNPDSTIVKGSMRPCTSSDEKQS